MRLRIQPADNGFVSLLTAIIISLLLLTITTSLMAVQVLTLRQAEDTEQSQRAYYAAESGAEDAIAKVNTKAITPGSPQTACASNPSILSGIGWSCQTVTFSGSPSGRLDTADQAVTVDPYRSGGSGFSTFRLMWDQSAQTATSYFHAPLTSAPVGLPGQSAWGNHALPLELTVVSYPGTTIAAGSIKTQNYLILPQQGGGGSYSIAAADGADPFYGACTLGGITDPSSGSLSAVPYHCAITFSGLTTSKNYLFRLRSLYEADGANNNAGSGRYVMNFFNGGLVAVADETATIDVTGEAGSVYRRVIYKQPVGPEAQSGLNYALFSDANICQDYTVLGGSRETTGAAAGTCPLN